MTTEATTRAKLTRLPPPEERCDPACKGWFIDQEKLVPVRCDECWHGIADPLDDEDAAALPEARAEAERTVKQVHDGEHGTAYEFYEGVCPLCREAIYGKEHPMSKFTDKQLIDTAKRLYHDGGTIEIDDAAQVSMPGDIDIDAEKGERGAYVQAWVWVAFEDVKP